MGRSTTTVAPSARATRARAAAASHPATSASGGGVGRVDEQQVVGAVGRGGEDGRGGRGAHVRARAGPPPRRCGAARRPPAGRTPRTARARRRATAPRGRARRSPRRGRARRRRPARGRAASAEKSASRTRSDVGRVPDGGTASRRPPAAPATILVTAALCRVARPHRAGPASHSRDGAVPPAVCVSLRTARGAGRRPRPAAALPIARRATVPACGAVIAASIFIASIVATRLARRRPSSPLADLQRSRRRRTAPRRGRGWPRSAFSAAGTSAGDRRGRAPAPGAAGR